MLLSSIGEDISPSLIEVICGIGLSAFWMDKTNLLFFNFALPDEELTRTFNILGFECQERIISKKQPIPIDQLKKDLKQSPVLIGPIDMGFLDYNPNHSFLHGADHYIFLYDFKDGNFYLHDPEKFPCVLLSEDQLIKSWQSDKIFYGLENYRYWTKPKRVNNPSESEIYKKAVKDFQSIYTNCDKKSKDNNWVTGSKAVLKAAERFKNKQFEENEIGHFKYFVLPLGAKRALDFAEFFSKRNPELAELKTKQAKLFGQAQTLIMSEDYAGFVKILRQYAKIEDKFKKALFKVK